MLLIVLLIALPLTYKLFPNDVTGALLFFGYLLIIFIVSVLMILCGLSGLLKQIKDVLLR